MYLLLGDESAELVPASDLWGKDIFETTDILKEKYSKQHKIVAIGPASENGVPFGSITNDYGHHFGRAGMGTVIGSKNLKAIAVKGSNLPKVMDEAKIAELRKAMGAPNPM